jgi:hypothetical protein
MKRAPIALLLACFICAAPLAAETESAEDKKKEDTGENYAPDEFPLWLREVRRAEVVSVGSFPSPFMPRPNTVYKFIAATSQAKPHSSTSHIQRRQESLLYAGIGLAVFIGFLDWILGKVEEAPRPQDPAVTAAEDVPGAIEQAPKAEGQPKNSMEQAPIDDSQ